MNPYSPPPDLASRPPSGFSKRLRALSFGGGLWPLILLTASVALVYGRVIGFDFLGWDDNHHVVENALLRTPSWQAIGRYFSAPFFDLYIPFTYTMWSVVHWTASWLRGTTQPSSAVFHATNLALHLANTLLVYSLARQMLSSRRSATACALLFALHPLQVEAVAWVSAARDLLSGTFALLALHAVVPGRGDRRALRPALFGLFLCAAVLAKPAAVSLPLAAAFLVVSERPGTHRRVRLIWLAVCAILALPLVAWTFAMQNDPTSFVPPALWSRVFVASDTVLFYLAKLLVPFPLLADYGRTPSSVLASPWCFFTPLIALFLAIPFIWPSRRILTAACRAAFTLALLAPVLGIIPFNFQRISTVADRYMYLAMVGPALLFGALWQGRRARWQTVFLGGLVALCGAISFHQTGYWRDTATLFSYTLSHNPRSIPALSNLGLATMATGDLPAAEAYFRRALALDPKAYQARLNLAVTLKDLGRIDEAIDAHRQVIEAMPQLPLPYVNLGELLHAKGRTDEALLYYKMALNIDSANALAHNNLGALLCDMGKFDEARTHLMTSINLSMNPALPYFNLGLLEIKSSQDDKALPPLTTALKFVSEFRPGEQTQLKARIHDSLALVNLHLHNLAEADRQAGEALAADPKNAQIHYNAGLIARALGENARARSQWQQTLALNPRLTEALADVAALDWEEGHRAEALKGMSEAVHLAPNDVRLRCNMAALLMLQGMAEQANDERRAATHLDPRAPCHF